MGVDVGTGSARAGVFDAAGRLLGSASRPIATLKPAEDFVEQSSRDIWTTGRPATRKPSTTSADGFLRLRTLLRIYAFDTLRSRTTFA
ncbi:FGGY family carbohydrate kinase [Neorhizobium sp. 2083]|uniref:FGGY family carbohydrate kinase n=1 Tax=Neorhizobium sp. 2083 TaxID=2817762 RepID=UPI00286D5BBE|nr:FGGY family carbohydrate kinase [Neorhizobium sp. 2083]